MKLSNVERLVLSNQYKILMDLNPDEVDYYEEKLKIVQNGYTHYYNDLFSEIDEELPEHISQEVVAVLNMYRAINFSYDDLKDDEKQEIPKHRVEFEGFDGNEEPQHYSFCRFVIEDSNRFQELHNKNGYNAHRDVLPKYRRMLIVWEKLGRKTDLSRDEIISLVTPPKQAI
ncbi:YfbU family protein [Paenibacillus foliorum]|nr:YfbU family protein [Paenibacillus foliorum]